MRAIIGEITHGGRTLPVFNQGIVVLSLPGPGEPGANAFYDRERFVRFIRVSRILRGTLDNVLGTTEALYASASRLVNARVVDYQWGLVRTPAVPRPDEYQHPSLPTGYSLAADRAVVADARHLSVDAVRFINQELVGVAIQAEDYGSYYWKDANSSQFLENPYGRWLIDMEPARLESAAGT